MISQISRWYFVSMWLFLQVCQDLQMVLLLLTTDRDWWWERKRCNTDCLRWLGHERYHIGWRWYNWWLFFCCNCYFVLFVMRIQISIAYNAFLENIPFIVSGDNPDCFVVIASIRIWRIVFFALMTILWAFAWSNDLPIFIMWLLSRLSLDVVMRFNLHKITI